MPRNNSEEANTMNKIFCDADIQEPLFLKWRDRFIEIITDGQKLPFRKNKTRMLDSYFIFNALNIQFTDKVLELGAWKTHAYIYAACMADEVIVSDNFSWAERDYNVNDGINPQEWIDEADRISNVTPMEIDHQNLPFNDNEFDKIYSISVLEHIKDDLVGLKEIKRILKPDGIFAMTTEINLFTYMEYRNDTYFRVYNLKRLLELIRDAGFALEDDIIIPNDLNLINRMSEATADQLIHHKYFTGIGVKLIK